MNNLEKITLPGSYENLTKLGILADQYWQSNHDVNSLVENLNQIFEPVDHTFLISLIDELLTCDKQLEEITKASYKNVTGFIKIVLASGGKNSWKLRLHVWEQKEKEYPHNHKWDFFSKIMTGYLKQTMYQSTDDVSNSEQYCICEPVSMMPLLANGEKACPCRDHYALEEKQTDNQHILLNVAHNNIIGTGETYFMTNNLIHTITPGKHAITFVFTSEHTSENSEVFVPSELIGTNLTKHAPSVTKEELIQELLFIKKILSRLSLSKKYLPELIHPNHYYFNRASNLIDHAHWRAHVLASEPMRYVAQLSEDEKNQYKINVNEQGQILIGKYLVKENTDYLFVLIDNVMYASPKDFAHQAHRLICHTSFTDYAPVDAAGLLQFNNQGALIKIEAYSGHYEPSLHHMTAPYQYLQSLGINMHDATISTYADRV